uniref:60S ribosomal protein L29-like n=1 Tax=Jaculus jaculus TaxID=51337 RepID=UPI001E1B3FD8|nr:60S ribosomal protein L29-like [Jaculus jaculus]
MPFSSSSGPWRLGSRGSKNPTTHHQSQKRHRNGPKKPRSQRCDSLKGVYPKFLRNMRFAKKHHKKGLRKVQANNARGGCSRRDRQGPVRRGQPWPKLPGSQPQAQPKLGKRVLTYIAKSRRLCQTQPQAQAVAPAQAPQ